MKKILLCLLVVSAFSACKMLHIASKPIPVVVDQSEVLKVVQLSTNQMLANQWLSDYLTQNHERPIMMTGKTVNNTGAFIDHSKVFETVDMEMMKSGQVRVIVSNYEQRNQIPTELVKGESVDIVISCSFFMTEQQTLQLNGITFRMELWGDKSNTPIISIENSIPTIPESL